jgi:hypothetical protein
LYLGVVDPSYKSAEHYFQRADHLTETRVSTEPFDYSNRSQKVSNQHQKFRFAETAQAQVQRFSPPETASRRLS